MKSQQEQELRTQVEQAHEKLQGLAADLRIVDDEVESLTPQRTQHEALEQACSSLEKLDELGCASLFWGERTEPARLAEQLCDVRSRVSAFRTQLDELDAQRQVILAEIGLQEQNLEILGEDIYDIRLEEERKKLEWLVERDISSVPPRVQRMAWSRGGEDDSRFYKALTSSLLTAALLGALLPLIDLPLPERFLPDAMPKRLAQLVRQEQAKLLPPPPVVADTPPEQQEPEAVDEPEPVEEQQPPQDAPLVAEAAPLPSERPGPPGPETPAVPNVQPRQRVQKAGILAFRDKFASLAKDDVAPKLGANARYGDADEASKAASSSRSMLTTNAPGSSGGINLAALSRNVGGGGGGGGDGEGGGGGIQGVPLGRATSSIAGIGGGGRPLAGGGLGASRTDEEIQIVFDRYKASFYRLYNRELRNDPTLRGQMVLRLTIEPDGSVSMCEVQSSDMDAPGLAAQVVGRVRALNFGDKDVKALTIVYPIDFLPAS